ncbi:YHYH domain-containing protein [Bacillus sp. AFS001701]|uniref:YHYH domain-containing protein n=1 Tax=Bacillus sp. AFS001701 TaxID=2033480 RepID=UPI0025711A51|nr:YHYH domain-containing protein [Bacillus sp. AFS001701]
MYRLLILLFFILIIPNVVYASPGGLDANGGHHCWTNCEKYGLKYGEYHYHNGNSNSNNNSKDDYNKGYDAGYNFAFKHASNCEEDFTGYYEGSKSYENGYNDGFDQGEIDGDAKCLATMQTQEEPDISEEPEEQIKPKVRTLQDINSMGFRDARENNGNYSSHFSGKEKEAYLEGYNDGLPKKDVVNKKDSKETHNQKPSKIDLFPYIYLSMVFLIPALILFLVWYFGNKKSSN